MTDKKVKDILTRRVGDELHIEHKSGLLEVLGRPNSGNDPWLLTRVYSAEGRHVRLEYGIRAGKRYLKELWDEQRRLLLIDLSGDSYPRITLWPDSEAKQLSFQFQLSNGDLTTISILAGSERLASWNFEYLREGGHVLISRLELPTGGAEWITYREDAQKLPASAPMASLPAVIRHAVIPRSDQPMIVREYTYSQSNYLGYGSTAPWQSRGDNLYQAAGDYEYSSEELLKTGSGADEKVVRRTTRTYNRFHLLVSEQTIQNGHVVSKTTEYHQKAGLTFEQQPPNFQLPRSESTAYRKTASPGLERTETNLTEFDDYGNLTKKVLPSGITELYEYFAAEGGDGCPADPLGMVRWLRIKVVIPAADRAPAPVISRHYRYVELTSASTERGSFIALQQESSVIDSSPVAQEAGVVCRTVKWEYQQAADSLFRGRVVRKVEAVKAIDTVYDYRYELVDGILKTHTTMSCLGVQSSKSVEHDALSGEEVATTDASDVRIETAYDRLGRIALETVAPGTAVQVQKRFEYRLANAQGDLVEAITTGINGAQTRTKLDGMKREISVQVEDVDQPDRPLRTVYEATYDNLGQLQEERRIDWLEGQALGLTTRHLHDDWGNRVTSIGPDGVSTHDQFDPISLVRSQWKEGAGKVVRVTNLFGKDESVERIDRNGQTNGLTRYAFDGLGRCVSKTDPRGYVTRFAYDFANRLLATYLPDGSVVSKRYVAHSTQDFAVAIEVDGYVIGSREFDGLLRVTQATTGGRTERFTFHKALPDPKTHTKASGAVLTYEYDPALNHQVLERSVSGNSDLSATYRYDGTFAQLIHAASPANLQQRSHSPSGKLNSELTVKDGQRFETTHRQSLQGRSLEYTDIAGQQRLTDYDPIGRVSRLRQGAVEATYEYNELGQVSRIQATDLERKRSFITSLEYDDFGHESRRLLTPADAEPELLEQRFDAGDRLEQRTLTRAGLIVRDERYEYDARGRLAGYRCAGSHPPQDSRGNAILSQTYTFDVLDNIRELTTEFTGGRNVSTFYYDLPDQTQLSRVEHSHPDYVSANMTFEYDADGHQLNDHQGRQLAYDALGRLTAVQEARA
ncbi:hypothetical protein AABC73_01410 [Pseudomonas sp. G.S.17]|uniref:hypothetical protein n=1 Tax=Pseudomonas sp. G.S.17 TaxID=3137451 RepID=UPI00311C9A78